MRTTLEEIISDPTSIYQGTLSHRIPHDLKVFIFSLSTGCPKKTWAFRDEFDIVFVMISIVIPNFNSHNIIMSARVYFMKTVNGAVKMCL